MRVTVRFFRVEASGGGVDKNSVDINIVQGANAFNHGLSGKPMFLAFWQGDVFLSPDFQNTTRTNTQITFDSPFAFGACVMEVMR